MPPSRKHQKKFTTEKKKRSSKLHHGSSLNELWSLCPMHPLLSSPLPIPKNKYSHYWEAAPTSDSTASHPKWTWARQQPGKGSPLPQTWPQTTPSSCWSDWQWLDQGHWYRSAQIRMQVKHTHASTWACLNLKLCLKYFTDLIRQGVKPEKYYSRPSPYFLITKSYSDRETRVRKYTTKVLTCLLPESAPSQHAMC